MNDTRHIKYNGNLNKESMSRFTVLISLERWILVYNNSDPEQAYSNFFCIFHPLYNSCFPLTTKYSNSNKLKHDWCTPGIVKSCKTKCKLYKSFIRNPAEIHKGNKLNHTIGIARQQYYFTHFWDNNVEKTWTCINTIMKQDKIKYSLLQIII